MKWGVAPVRENTTLAYNTYRPPVPKVSHLDIGIVNIYIYETIFWDKSTHINFIFQTQTKRI